MAITLTGSSGLGTRLGHIFGIAADIMAHQGAASTTNVGSGASLATRATTLESDMAASTAISDVLGDQYQAIGSYRSSASGLLTYLKGLAERVVIKMADNDANLPTKDLTTALRELRRQMRANTTSIEAGSASAGSQTTVSATGSLKIVCSVKDYEGYTLANAFAETLRFTTAADAQTGGATARNESVNVRGKAAVSNTFDYLWPSSGSGCNKTINVVDAQSDNSRGNLLYNSDFETTTTSNRFDNWIYTLGTAGTHIAASSSANAYTGSKAMELIGDGSTLITVRQNFDTAASTTAGSGGTPAELEPLTEYAVGFWMKRLTALSAGVLRVALVDGDGNVTNDASGTANSFTVDLTGGSVTTSYAFFSGTFRTPALTPTTGYMLEFKTTTAHDTGESIVIDDCAFAETTPLYNRGPSVAIFAGSTNTIRDDAWTIAISSSPGKFASWLERFFSMRDKDIQLPYDASPTIDDDLVA